TGTLAHFLHPAEAMHGDLVAISVTKPLGRRASGRGPAGRVVRVVEHARREVVGTFHRDGHLAYVEPTDSRLYRDIYIPSGAAKHAQPGDRVVAAITAWPRRGLNPEGVIQRVLGDSSDPRVQVMAVIEEYGLPEDFAKEALAQADALPPRVSAADMEDRLDLRHVLTFTIDPEDAKDHDDAVSIRVLPGGWELGVHIADVAHYVPPDTPVDLEARRRGVTAYLPGRVLPMLPEALSANLCSLREDRTRLTRSVIMRFDAQGHRQDSVIARSVIHSRRSLNYKQVMAYFDGKTRLDAEVEPALDAMRQLAALLRRNRRERGMLELDLPEAKLLLDHDGAAKTVELVRQDESHKLIEQFMLSANEAVAEFLVDHSLPCVGRCHDEPPPENLIELREDLRGLGYSLPCPGTRKQIQQVVDKAAGREEACVVNTLVLRAMCRADYRPSIRGHYAIATRRYTHFTSPIRRYPDLLVHRILTEYETGRLAQPGRLEYWNENLDAWTRDATTFERRAEEAERALTRRLTVALMARDPAQTFDAIVTRVDDRGAYVAITGMDLEGRLGFKYMRDDFYRVDRRGGRLVSSAGGQIRAGRHVTVRLAEACADRGEAVFALCQPAR
ncbi:MAG TPA: VacB/RNase II family 3'-5' exoribonuclease, partial [Candidatus Brocadiia bacterium]|nr:VacB/RNase II family 3'-5' exoribonuclease [Candidatus Brocadiia bacterium]